MFACQVNVGLSGGLPGEQNSVYAMGSRSGLAHHHQTLEVLALGKTDSHRVIGGAAHALGNKTVYLGVGP